MQGEIAGEAVGGEDVEAVEGTGGGLITQAFQGGTNQGAATEAVVEEVEVVVAGQAIRGDAARQGLDLTGDGPLLGLVVGGDAGIEGGPLGEGFGSHATAP